MKPFRFSLQPIRVLREQKERLAQQRYAGTLRACEEAAGRLQVASEALSSCWTELGRELAAGVTSTELLRTRAWCNVLELRLKEQAGALEQARHDVDAVWQEMLLATRDREALDRYHDKSRLAYGRDRQHEEQKHLDELAVQLARFATPFRPAQPTRSAPL